MKNFDTVLVGFDHSRIRLHDIPWIEPVELKCTYFRQDTGAIR